MPTRKLFLIVKKNNKEVIATITETALNWATKYIWDDMEIVEVQNKQGTKTIPTSFGIIIATYFTKIGNGNYHSDYLLIVDYPSVMTRQEAYRLINF